MKAVLGTILAATVVMLTVAPVGADEQRGFSWQLFGQLERERSLSEFYVTERLEMISKNDRDAYYEGVRLYAVAKAEFDGLIEQIKYDLTSGRDLDQSEAYKAALRTAVERRIAFTTYIDQRFPGSDNEKQGGIAAALTTAGDLLAALTEVGEAIWNAYREAKKEDREELLHQLDDLKWKPFHMIRARQ